MNIDKKITYYILILFFLIEKTTLTRESSFKKEDLKSIQDQITDLEELKKRNPQVYDEKVHAIIGKIAAHKVSIYYNSPISLGELQKLSLKEFNTLKNILEEGFETYNQYADRKGEQKKKKLNTINKKFNLNADTSEEEIERYISLVSECYKSLEEYQVAKKKIHSNQTHRREENVTFFYEGGTFEVTDKNTDNSIQVAARHKTPEEIAREVERIVERKLYKNIIITLSSNDEILEDIIKDGKNNLQEIESLIKSNTKINKSGNITVLFEASPNYLNVLNGKNNFFITFDTNDQNKNEVDRHATKLFLDGKKNIPKVILQSYFIDEESKKNLAKFLIHSFNTNFCNSIPTVTIVEEEENKEHRNGLTYLPTNTLKLMDKNLFYLDKYNKRNDIDPSKVISFKDYCENNSLIKELENFTKNEYEKNKDNLSEIINSHATLTITFFLNYIKNSNLVGKVTKKEVNDCMRKFENTLHTSDNVNNNLEIAGSDGFSTPPLRDCRNYLEKVCQTIAKSHNIKLITDIEIKQNDLKKDKYESILLAHICQKTDNFFPFSTFNNTSKSITSIERLEDECNNINKYALDLYKRKGNYLDNEFFAQKYDELFNTREIKQFIREESEKNNDSKHLTFFNLLTESHLEKKRQELFSLNDQKTIERIRNKIKKILHQQTSLIWSGNQARDFPRIDQVASQVTFGQKEISPHAIPEKFFDYIKQERIDPIDRIYKDKSLSQKEKINAIEKILKKNLIVYGPPGIGKSYALEYMIQAQQDKLNEIGFSDHFQIELLSLKFRGPYQSQITKSFELLNIHAQNFHNRAREQGKIGILVAFQDELGQFSMVSENASSGSNQNGDTQQAQITEGLKTILGTGLVSLVGNVNHTPKLFKESVGTAIHDRVEANGTNLALTIMDMSIQGMVENILLEVKKELSPRYHNLLKNNSTSLRVQMANYLYSCVEAEEGGRATQKQLKEYLTTCFQNNEFPNLTRLIQEKNAETINKKVKKLQKEEGIVTTEESGAKDNIIELIPKIGSYINKARKITSEDFTANKLLQFASVLGLTALAGGSFSYLEKKRINDFIMTEERRLALRDRMKEFNYFEKICSYLPLPGFNSIKLNFLGLGELGIKNDDENTSWKYIAANTAAYGLGSFSLVYSISKGLELGLRKNYYYEGLWNFPNTGQLVRCGIPSCTINNSFLKNYTIDLVKMYIKGIIEGDTQNIHLFSLNRKILGNALQPKNQPYIFGEENLIARILSYITGENKTESLKKIEDLDISKKLEKNKLYNTNSNLLGQILYLFSKDNLSKLDIHIDGIHNLIFTADPNNNSSQKNTITQEELFYIIDQAYVNTEEGINIKKLNAINSFFKGKKGKKLIDLIKKHNKNSIFIHEEKEHKENKKNILRSCREEVDIASKEAIGDPSLTGKILSLFGIHGKNIFLSLTQPTKTEESYLMNLYHACNRRNRIKESLEMNKKEHKTTERTLTQIIKKGENEVSEKKTIKIISLSSDGLYSFS
jgi:hypothetical protein